MTKRIFAVALLSLALTACESNGTDNSNASSPKPNNQAASTPAQVAATPAATPSLEASPATTAKLKAGEAVKVSINGAVAEATVVSVDEKAGKVTVKLKADGKERTMAITDIVKP